ncbi:MAG: cyclic pyranopterin monophosphate synthase MoaC [Bacteroidales bacterium]|nr:cyclic pyranopterin monophosphate synthase MoaC [Bacteroidales bacterium]MCF8327559.1 cyclic pyranopterin monophosphate synthase MoaC [Bacteroidales bacterium]
MGKLTHTDKKGNARMVDVSEKPESQRTAIAEGYISLQKETLQLVEKNQLSKGDVLQVARLAGIQGAKKTSELIFLAHPLNLTHIDVALFLEEKGIRVQATTKITDRTGVEMEALTAVNVALLNIYDMCKAVDQSMQISDIRLKNKQKI